MNKIVLSLMCLLLPFMILCCSKKPTKVEEPVNSEISWVQFSLNGVPFKYTGGLYPAQIQDKSLYSEKPYLLHYEKNAFPGFFEQYSIAAFQNTIYDTSRVRSGIIIGIVNDNHWKIQICMTDSNGIKTESKSIAISSPVIDTSVLVGDVVSDTLDYVFGLNAHDTVSNISFSVKRIY